MESVLGLTFLSVERSGILLICVGTTVYIIWYRLDVAAFNSLPEVLLYTVVCVCVLNDPV